MKYSNCKLRNLNTKTSSSLPSLNSNRLSKISSPLLIKPTLSSITITNQKRNSSSWAASTIASLYPNSKIKPIIFHNLIRKPINNCPTLHSKNLNTSLKKIQQPNNSPTKKTKIKVLIFVLVDISWFYFDFLLKDNKT